MEIFSECRNGNDALRAIEKLNPDLVFLDVQMPELTGFEVLDRLDPARMPVVIFVTAYHQYALKAFEVSALDYLLKPFDRERFRRSLGKARDEFGWANALGANQRVWIHVRTSACALFFGTFAGRTPSGAIKESAAWGCVTSVAPQNGQLPATSGG